MLKLSGFTYVDAVDETTTMKTQLELDDLVNANRLRTEFQRRFSDADFDSIISDISSKLEWLSNGLLKWNVIVAKKMECMMTPPKTPNNVE